VEELHWVTKRWTSHKCLLLTRSVHNAISVVGHTRSGRVGSTIGFMRHSLQEDLHASTDSRRASGVDAEALGDNMKDTSACRPRFLKTIVTLIEYLTHL